jgi:hypothetical protein
MTQDEIKTALWSMPYNERAAFLICSIIEDNKNDPALAVCSLIKVGRVMSDYLNETDCYRIAETMRDVADQVEHRQPVIVS